VVGDQAAYNNWRCVDATGGTRLFSMERACQWIYGIDAVLAQPLDPNDAFSWVCYAPQPTQRTPTERTREEGA
jgi:hypothetical protein